VKNKSALQEARIGRSGGGIRQQAPDTRQWERDQRVGKEQGRDEGRRVRGAPSKSKWWATATACLVLVLGGLARCGFVTPENQ
jgi:hypothetical protein